MAGMGHLAGISARLQVNDDVLLLLVLWLAAMSEPRVGAQRVPTRRPCRWITVHLRRRAGSRLQDDVQNVSHN
jgi:hypothetical protein